MSKFIDSHKAVLKQVGNVYLDAQSNLPNHQLNQFNPSEGHGYSEVYAFDRLCIGKGKYWLDHPLEMSANTPMHCFGVTILLSGTHHIKNHKTNQHYEFHSPMIVLRKGDLGVQTIYLQQHAHMSLITLDFDENLLSMLEQSLSKNGLIKFFLNAETPSIKSIKITNKDLNHQAQYLLNLPPAKNTIDLLHLEGAALELLSLLLQKGNESLTITPQIQTAISILQNQFDQKITIRQLAKQVGINECDLKRQFKAGTGQTIGNFLLHTRMKYAQMLLKEGTTAETVANKIGYSSTQYFRQIFEKHFGYAP